MLLGHLSDNIEGWGVYGFSLVINTRVNVLIVHSK